MSKLRTPLQPVYHLARCEYDRVHRVSWWVIHLILVGFNRIHDPYFMLILPASIDWGCAVQVAAAINIGNQNFVATQAQTLCVAMSWSPSCVPLLVLALLIIMQRDLCSSNHLSWYHLLSWD